MTSIIRLTFFVAVSKVPVKEMALALFTKISIPGFKVSHFTLAFKEKKHE